MLWPNPQVDSRTRPASSLRGRKPVSLPKSLRSQGFVFKTCPSVPGFRHGKSGFNGVKGNAMLKEFKEFALKGNVVDLAIGVIIGAAFGKIVDSMVGDIFMPLIGAVVGGLNFDNYFLALSKTVTATNVADAAKQGAVLAYGKFLTVSINFVIIAWVLFMVVKGMNRLKQQQAAEAPAAPAEPPAQEKLLTEIRDLLKK